MEPFKALTDFDKENIVNYIETFAIPGGGRMSASLDNVLCYWNTEKQKLFKILGEKLIIKKTFQVAEERETIVRNIDEYLVSNEPGTEFVRAYKELRRNTDLFPDNCWASILSSFDLVDSNSLYKNKTCNEFTMLLPDGKTLKVPYGAKVMRSLQKIAKAYNLPDFEIFRNRISRFPEVRNREVEITLSIHPLDFMTMSDNDNDWDSCMNWTNSEPGSYRGGTVEMLNSPNVIIAYITTKNFKPCYNVEWNSKSWRELVIVEPYMISTVKSYPYYNKEFDKNIVNWIAELAAPVFGVEYNLGKPLEDLEDYISVPETIWPADNGIGYDITIDTGCMYNDFGNTENYAIFSKTPPENKSFHCCYSGPWSCMICGDDEEYDTEEVVVCSNCDTPIYCYCCGDRIRPGSEIMIDDRYVCDYCYEQLDRCAICEDAYFEDSLIKSVIYDFDEEKIELKYGYNLICSDCSWQEYFGNNEIITIRKHFIGKPFYGESILLIDKNTLTEEEKEQFRNNGYNTEFSYYNIERYANIFK